MYVHVRKPPTRDLHFSVCRTLQVFYSTAMGKGDHRKTLELDKRQLAELTERSSENRTATRELPTTTEEITVGRARTLDDPLTTNRLAAEITVSRAHTLDDPLTTGLLAEVSRRSQTTEFDGDAIDTILDSIADDDVAVIVDKPVTHPRVTRRSS
jgi:hypothetical protein